MVRHLLTAALLVAASGAAAAPAGRPRVKVAVTEVKNIQGVAPGTATIISDIVVSEIARQGYEVVSQSDINAMLGFERQKRALGCSEDSSCLAEIGGALGVDFMLTGQVGQIGSRYRISVLAVDTRKARVVARAAQFCEQDEDALARAAEQTVATLLAAMRGEVPPPAVAAAPPATAGVATPRSASPTPSAGASKPAAPAAQAAKPAEPKPASPSLEARPPPAEPAAAEGGRTASRGDGRGSRRTTAYLAMGAGGALVVAGLVAGAAARSGYDDLTAHQGDLGYPAYYAENRGRVRGLSVTADVLTGVGLATTGVGVWFWLKSRPGDLAIAPATTPAGDLAVVAAGRF
jgi:TolB-like protein